MKFAINRTISYTNKDRLLILERNETYHTSHSNLMLVRYFCCALIEVTRDWDDSNEYPIVSDTDSIQIRPKAIFKSSKGYYYKSNKIIYLTESEVEKLDDFIKKAKRYLVD